MAQLPFQLDKYRFEFHHGICDDAGRQGCTRDLGSSPTGADIVDVQEPPQHARRNRGRSGMSSIPKSLHALIPCHQSSPSVVPNMCSVGGAMFNQENSRKNVAWPDVESDALIVRPRFPIPNAAVRQLPGCEFVVPQR